MITAGLHFASGDHVTMDMGGASGAGTHLSNSLKDLSKLSISEVTMQASGMSVDLGSFSAGDLSAAGGVLPHIALSGAGPQDITLDVNAGNLGTTTGATAYLIIEYIGDDAFSTVTLSKQIKVLPN
jgi:hypothetical protein